MFHAWPQSGSLESFETMIVDLPLSGVSNTQDERQCSKHSRRNLGN